METPENKETLFFLIFYLKDLMKSILFLAKNKKQYTPRKNRLLWNY